VIAAHNEEAVIQERVENLLELDYPAHLLQLIIASDGSRDRTCDIVRSHGRGRIELLEFRTNRGKAAVLNDAVAASAGEIIVLSDANTMMEHDAVRRLARWFSDPEIGVVCGRLLLVDSVTGQNADGVYWKYETFLKKCEARLGALLGVNGAIYAIRRSLFPTLPHRIAVDDFVIPLLARLKAGSRIEYDAEAIAHEETAPAISSEFTRRARIGAGGFQSIALLWPLLAPRQGWIALSFFSHKILRWVCPFFLVGAFAANGLLADDPLFRSLFLTQLALYLVAVLGYVSPRFGARYKVARLPTMFATMNLALLAGFFQWALGRQTGVWQRTARF
jgi:cellulose synthase/poly-beta-1,6-N-acetylglucosamine synthase-like glycosyltransferase